ncbi:hypothetical protein B0I29_12886 [Actinoplanes lutulentus]|uniref:Uncharacterized protein n=1 Tax=Actinoplanes lutulentus TaxID=1287878 RepID=A0A327YXC8_9ACTN|nr:hypothetical protein B0I29_12886 [Actinoplanes lutulentus]
MFDHPVSAWWTEPQLPDDDSIAVGRLLGRLEHQPTTELWNELERKLAVEAECWYLEGFAALPALARIVQSGAETDRLRALDLAAVIVRTLHQNHLYDDVVRANSEAVTTLCGFARTRLTTSSDLPLTRLLQDTLAFAGYTFWSSISLDFTDEHYHVSCPHCSTRLAIVIGEYGHYSAFRHYQDGDIDRIPLNPTAPDELTGTSRWMHDAAAAGGDMLLAEGLTYLFGKATCCLCGSTFNLADWLEAENSPHQPIDPIVPKS